MFADRDHGPGVWSENVTVGGVRRGHAGASRATRFLSVVQRVGADAYSAYHRPRIVEINTQRAECSVTLRERPVLRLKVRHVGEPRIGVGGRVELANIRERSVGLEELILRAAPQATRIGADRELFAPAQPIEDAGHGHVGGVQRRRARHDGELRNGRGHAMSRRIDQPIERSFGELRFGAPMRGVHL